MSKAVHGGADGRAQGEADARERAVAHREREADRRDEASRVRAGSEHERAERDRLVAEMREVNEQLVFATVRADELAEVAAAANAAITASEERFRSLVTTSAAIVFRADAHGSIRPDSQSWREFTGMDAGEPGVGWLEAVHPDDRADTLAAWTAALADEKLFTHQHRLRKIDGTWAWVAARAVPILASGEVREWIGTLTDVSDRVRVEDAREQFIAILGHDLRSPLATVAMGAQLLARDGRSDEDAQTIARISRGARRMEAMIRDLLDFARGRLGGGIPIKRTRTDLRRVTTGEVAAARQTNPDRPIELEVTGDLTGDWDPDQLEQVFSNLISNGIRHGVGVVRVVARDAGDEVVVTVHSEGAHIPAVFIPSVFEAFRRRTDRPAVGLGLGLYIVSEIVRAHAGAITVRSAEGEGTTFEMRLPRRAPR